MPFSQAKAKSKAKAKAKGKASASPSKDAQEARAQQILSEHHAGAAPKEM